MEKEIDYGKALRRGWWLLLIMLAAGIGGAMLLTSRQEPVYETSATLVVAPSRTTTEPDEIVRGLETLERRTVIATFARIPTTREAKESVAVRLGVDSDALRGVRIHGSVLPNTNIIRISAQGPEAEMVAAAANAAAELTAEEATTLYRVYELYPMEEAREPRRPDFPDPRRNLLVGAVIGLVIGLAAALALDRLRTPGRAAGAS